MHKFCTGINHKLYFTDWDLLPVKILTYLLKLRILQTIGRFPWTKNRLLARPLPTQEGTNTNTEQMQTYIDTSS
jgi:hypothetical protein